MAKERRKILRAGRLWYAMQYTSLRGGTPSRERRAKSDISSAVREQINFRTSRDKLWLILEATFAPDDLWITLTYRDEDLPKRRDDAEKRMKAFIKALRSVRKDAGNGMVYVWNTEGYHSGGRLHHHLFINSTVCDYTTIRNLWKKNGDEVEILPFSCKTAFAHAEYTTKEPREKGRRHVGDRMWRSSRNIKRPEVIYEDVESDDELTAPAGSFINTNHQIDNSFGRFRYVEAILPVSTTEYKIQP